jgi:muramoyltetrapeptide carboxypeptidase
MAAAFNEGENEFILSLKKALTGKKNSYTCKHTPFNKPGKVTGELIGGNLTLLANLCGTGSEIDTKNKILFIEDIGEYIYSIDRMLYQLKRSKKLDQLAGLIVGGFTDLKDTERPFGKTIYQVIDDLAKEYTYPVCYDFPVSHNTENVALKSGCTYTLTVTKKNTQLREL